MVFVLFASVVPSRLGNECNHATACMKGVREQNPVCICLIGFIHLLLPGLHIIPVLVLFCMALT